MKESIYTIPISEVFEKHEGCPLCGLRRNLEQHWSDYITGPAMMEPDVRQETNKLGFCRNHYDDILKCKNRLSVALILQTHIDELISANKAQESGRLFGKKTANAAKTCFICSYFGREFDRMLENIAVVWARDAEFQGMYIQQEYVCSEDLNLILEAARRKLSSKKYREFAAVSKGLWEKRAVALKRDIDAFCKLYDYRSAGTGTPSEEVSSAVERAISFLAPE